MLPLNCLVRNVWYHLGSPTVSTNTFVTFTPLACVARIIWIAASRDISFRLLVCRCILSEISCGEIRRTTHLRSTAASVSHRSEVVKRIHLQDAPELVVRTHLGEEQLAGLGAQRLGVVEALRAELGVLRHGPERRAVDHGAEHGATPGFVDAEHHWRTVQTVLWHGARQQHRALQVHISAQLVLWHLHFRLRLFGVLPELFHYIDIAMIFGGKSCE